MLDRRHKNGLRLIQVAPSVEHALNPVRLRLGAVWQRPPFKAVSLDYLGVRYVGLCLGMTYVPLGPGIV
jgi:hypothetical protein